MKALLRKDYYSSKIHTLLMKKELTPLPSIDNPSICNLDYPPPPRISQKNLDAPFYDFSKISTPSITNGGIEGDRRDLIDLFYESLGNFASKLILT